MIIHTMMGRSYQLQPIENAYRVMEGGVAMLLYPAFYALTDRTHAATPTGGVA